MDSRHGTFRDHCVSFRANFSTHLIASRKSRWKMTNTRRRSKSGHTPGVISPRIRSRRRNPADTAEEPPCGERRWLASRDAAPAQKESGGERRNRRATPAIHRKERYSQELQESPARRAPATPHSTNISHNCTPGSLIRSSCLHRWPTGAAAGAASGHTAESKWRGRISQSARSALHQPVTWPSAPRQAS